MSTWTETHTHTYSDIDGVKSAIVSSLEEYADDFDLDAIVQDLSDEGHLKYRGGVGYSIDATSEEYWGIIAKHDTAA